MNKSQFMITSRVTTKVLLVGIYAVLPLIVVGCGGPNPVFAPPAVSMNIAPGDIREDGTATVTCTVSPGGGNRQQDIVAAPTLNVLPPGPGGGGTVAPAAGAPAPAPRSQTGAWTFTPDVTGNSRNVRLLCQGWDRGNRGGSDSGAIVVREASKPEVVAITPIPAIPPNPTVGAQFTVKVEVKDNPENFRSGILFIHANPVHPVVILEPRFHQVPAGVSPGPPTNAAGPETADHTFKFKCVDRGDVFIAFSAEDVVGNLSRSDQINFACD